MKGDNMEHPVAEGEKAQPKLLSTISKVRTSSKALTPAGVD